MTYNEIASQVAEELGLPKEIVDRTYRAYWKTIRDYVSNLPLKEGLDEEAFKSVRPTVNIPSLGKLTVSYERYRAMIEDYREKVAEDMANSKAEE